MRGPSSISIVETVNFSAKHIHNFWNFRGVDSTGAVVAIDPDGVKLVGIGSVEGPNFYQTIHVFDGNDGVTAFEANDIVPGVELWTSLESSIDGDIFFIAGSESREYNTGNAYLAALTFDENADIITYSKYGNQHKFYTINSLRRHPDGNVLFAGTQAHLVVVLWAEDEFHLIAKLANVVQNPIHDICFNQNTIYTVSEHNMARVYYFDDDMISGRSQKREFVSLADSNRQKSSKGSGPLSHSNNPYIQDNDNYQSKPSYQKLGTFGDKNEPPKSQQAINYTTRPPRPARNKNLFNEYSIKQIHMPDGKPFFSKYFTTNYFFNHKLEQLLRVQVSSDKRYIFTGKNHLKVLQFDVSSGKYLLLKAGADIAPFIDIKVLNNGEMLVYEEHTSDLVKYTKKLVEMSRINGVKPLNLRDGHSVSSLHTGDDLMYIWMPGDSSIGLVNPDNMIYDLVTNFYGSSGEKITPLALVGNQLEKKVLGSYTKQNGEVWYTFLRAGQGLIRKSQYEVLQNRKKIIFLFL